MRYSPVPTRWVPRPLKFVMHVYLDDSESLNGAGIVCLAGFAARDDKWAAFATAWATLTVRLDLPPGVEHRFLHTSDFLAGKPPYDQPARTYEERVAIVRQFIGIIRDHVEFGVGVGVDGAAFREATAGDRKRMAPNLFCFHRVLRVMMDGTDTFMAPGEIISLVMDDSESTSMRSYGALRELKKRHRPIRDRIGSITFADDRFFQPCQAADLLACISIRESRRDQRDQWSEAFDSFGELLRAPSGNLGLEYRSEMWDRDHITANADLIRQAAKNSV